MEMLMKSLMLNTKTLVLMGALAAAAPAAAQQAAPPAPAQQPAAPAQQPPAPAQQPPTPQQPPASAQQPAASAQQPAAAPAQAQAPTEEPYIVGQAKPPVEPGASVRDMSLEQAIEVALENNLDLKVARMNPQIQDYSLQAARAAFNPVLGSNFNQNRGTRVSVNGTDGVPRVISQSQTYSTSLTQNLAKFGANYSVQFSSRRSTDNTLSNTRPLTYTGSTQFSYSQPLLANFKIDNTRNNIRTQQVQRQIVDIQLLTRIENTKADVRVAYWALRQAIEQVEIQKRALDLSQRLLQDNRTKVEIGTLAPIDLVQNEATVANNEQALLGARVRWQTAELTLKRLLVTGTEDPLYAQTINPIEQPPALEQVQVDIPGAIKTALQERTDIAQTKKSLESNGFTLELRKNATMPSLNLSSTYTLAGTGGPEYARNGVFRGDLINDSGYLDVLRGIGQIDQPTWTVGLNFSYPLGMVAQRAALAQAQIQYQQALANLKAQELSVSTDVTSAGLAVQNTYQQLLAARKSREAAERNAGAEQTRYDNGMSNNYNIATAQNDLTSRRVLELNAIIAYVNAIADYEKKQRIGGTGAAAGGQ
jgi:HAE1 family hydrophobic/amphiphilic exporter-1